MQFFALFSTQVLTYQHFHISYFKNVLCPICGVFLNQNLNDHSSCLFTTLLASVTGTYPTLTARVTSLTTGLKGTALLCMRVKSRQIK